MQMKDVWAALAKPGKNHNIQIDDTWYYITSIPNVLLLREQANSGTDYYSKGKETTEVIITYHRDIKKFGLYKQGRISDVFIKQICENFNVELPSINLDDDGFVIGITPNHKIFPDKIRITFSVSGGYTRKCYPTDEYPDGIDIIEGDGLRIVNNVIEKFTEEDDLYMPWWIYRFAYTLKDGKSVKITEKGDKRWLVRQHKVGDSLFTYPVNVKGEIIKGEKGDIFWGGRKNLLKTIARYLIENGKNLPENWKVGTARYHFYGKSVNLQSVGEYIESLEDDLCQCERCRGYRIFRAANKNPPYYYGWTIQHYKALHAGINGSLPTNRQLLQTCNCKACKSFRNTKDTKHYFLKEKFEEKFEEKGYTDNQRDYITADFLADPLIFPEDVPNKEEASIDDWRWRAKTRYFKNIFSGGQLPLKFPSVEIRYQFAIIHCRLTNVEYEDIEKEAKKWLLDVFNTMLEPECTCKLCTELKNCEDMRLSVAYELLMENVNPESYPVITFTKHFSTNAWGDPIKPKQDYIDWFKKFVLVGKECDCDNCQSWLDNPKNTKYLPPKELQAPKCPLCGKKVHNADLIYKNAEIAKSIIEKGASKLIGVKTALCCSCYNEFKMNNERRKIIGNMKVGDTFSAEIRGERNVAGELRGVVTRHVKEVWEKGTKKEDKVPGTGTLCVHVNGEDVELSEFISWNNITRLRLSSEMETALQTASRG